MKDAHSSGRSMVVFREFPVWPKFYLQICCALCSIVLYCTAIYRDSVEWPIAFGITNTIDTVPVEQLWIVCVNIYMNPCANCSYLYCNAACRCIPYVTFQGFWLRKIGVFSFKNSYSPSVLLLLEFLCSPIFTWHPWVFVVQYPTSFTISYYITFIWY